MPESTARPGGVHSTPQTLVPTLVEESPAAGRESPWPRRRRIALGVGLPTVYAIGIVAALLAATGVIDP